MTEPLRRQRRRTLTDKMVAALPKKKTRYVVPDPEMRGLYLRVMPKGANVFAAVARDPYRKQVWATLDSADVLKIEQAREKAREAIRRIKEGKPAFEPPPVKPDAFKSVAETWVQRHVAAKKLRSQSEIERCLEKYVYPSWRYREFTSIKRSDIARLLDHIEDNHGARQADMVLSIVRGISNWYATRHDDFLSPFTRGMRRVNGGAGKRARILDDDELRSVWKHAQANGTFGALIRVLVLTGQRRGPVTQMCWADVSSDGMWKIPAEAREKGNAGALRLPGQALAIINAQPRQAKNKYVFAATRGDGPLNGFSKIKAQFDKRCGVTGWTLHDLRRTSRSLMSRAGVRPDIAERVLGHTITGVEGIYDRFAYTEEKADALRKLSSLIETIVNPPADNVRQLRHRAAKS